MTLAWYTGASGAAGDRLRRLAAKSAQRSWNLLAVRSDGACPALSYEPPGGYDFSDAVSCCALQSPRREGRIGR